MNTLTISHRGYEYSLTGWFITLAVICEYYMLPMDEVVIV